MGISALADPVGTNNAVYTASTGVVSVVSDMSASVSKMISPAPFTNGGAGSEIPEFPALAIPVATIIGLLLLFQHKKAEQKK